MRIYRMSQDGEAVEIEVPAVEVEEAEPEDDSSVDDAPEPVNEDMEWALSIVDDERAAAWLVAAKRGNRLDGHDDGQLRELMDAYGEMNGGDYSRIGFLYGVSDLAKIVAGDGVEGRKGVGSEITERTVQIVNDAVAMGWIGEDTARRAVNPSSGVVPVGRLTETGKKKVRQYQKVEMTSKEVVDEEGNSFILTETRDERPPTMGPYTGQARKYDKDPSRVYVQPPDAIQLFGVSVSMESGSYEWDMDLPSGGRKKIEKETWTVRLLSFMPTRPEIDLFMEIESALDGLFEDGIRKYHENSQRLFDEMARDEDVYNDNTGETTRVRKPDDTVNEANFNASHQVRLQNYYWRMGDDEVIKTKSPEIEALNKEGKTTLLWSTYEGFGDMPDAIEMLSSVGSVEGVTMSQRKRGKHILTERGDRKYPGLTFTVAPEDELTEEGYNETIDTLSRLNGDGSGIRLLDGMPESVQGMMKRGALGISDDRDVYSGMTKLFPKLRGAAAFIVAGFGISKFRIMINPDTAGHKRLQAAAHELGHFVYYYMLSGVDYFADQREGNAVKEWNDWYRRTGTEIEDVANRFVQSSYPEDLWASEYFAEVSSAVLMVSGELAGQISGDVPAISPESYAFAQRLMREARMPETHPEGSRFKRKNRVVETEDEMLKTEVLSVNDKMADYGRLLEPPPARRRLTWFERGRRMERRSSSAESPLSVAFGSLFGTGSTRTPKAGGIR